MVNQRINRIFAVEFDGIFLKDAAERKRQCRTAIGVWLDFYIRGNASAVIYGASVLGLESLLKRVRNSSHTAVRITVGVVHDLDASSARSVILGDGELEFPVVAYRTETLYKAFAVCAGSNYEGAVKVLERSCHNL